MVQQTGNNVCSTSTKHSKLYLIFRIPLARVRGSMKVEGGPVVCARWILKSTMEEINISSYQCSAQNRDDVNINIDVFPIGQSTSVLRAQCGAAPNMHELFIFFAPQRVTRDTLIELTILQCISKILFRTREQLLIFSQKKSRNTLSFPQTHKC